MSDLINGRLLLAIAGVSLFLHMLLLSAHYYMEKDHLTADTLARAHALKPLLIHDLGKGPDLEPEISAASMEAVFAARYGRDGAKLAAMGALRETPSFIEEKVRDAAAGNTAIAMADEIAFRNWDGEIVTGSIHFVFMPASPSGGEVLAIGFDVTFQKENIKRSALFFFLFSGTAIWTAAAMAFLLIRKLQDAEKRAKEAALETTAMKNSILSTVSHELRTPLNGIVGMITVLKDTELTEEQMRYAGVAERCASDLMELVNKIIEHIRFETGKLTIIESEFSPARSAALLADVLRPEAARRGLEIELQVKEGVPALVRGDEEKIGRILHTFVDNAVRFTREGKVSFLVELAGGGAGTALLRFSVTDTGIGIEPDKIEAIFTPLTQGDQTFTRREGGLGLGLSLASGLAKVIGGTISAESRPGRGSVFQLVVPLKTVERVNSSSGEAPEPEVMYTEQMIMERVGGDLLLALRLMSGFGEEVNALVAGMEDDIKEGNGGKALQKARSLKNVASPMGAVRLGKAAEEMEKALSGSGGRGIQDILETLKNLSMKINRALKAQGSGHAHTGS